MSQQTIVVVKQFHNSNIEHISTESSRTIAENKALLVYTERSAYMAAAIELLPHELTPESRMNIIFKIERNCKCTNIQRKFNFKAGSSIALCVDCALPFGTSKAINEPEEQDALLEEDVILV